MSSVIQRKTAPVLTVLVLLIGLVGCATRPIVEQTRLVWPPAPETTRIEFVRTITGEQDIHEDTTFSQKLLHWLGGVEAPPTRIVEPMGIAVSDDGERLYVANYNRLAVFVFDFGQKKFREIGPLQQPVGLALDDNEYVYVVEQGKKQITVFNQDGEAVSSITHPDIYRPSGIAIDRRLGRIYLADTGRNEELAKLKSHNVKIFSLAGELLGTIGQGMGDGPGQFRFPTYLAVDEDSKLYVADTLNGRVQVFDSRGVFTKTLGERGNAWGMFDKPKGIAVDNFGNVYVTDSGWSNVQIFNQNGDVLLFFGGRGPIPGMLRNPTAIAIDGRNHIYVADFVNHRVNEYRLVNTTAADSYSATQSEAHSGIGMTLRWAAQLHQLRAAKTNRASLNTVVETAPADGIKLRLDREFNHDAKLL